MVADAVYRKIIREDDCYLFMNRSEKVKAAKSTDMD
jgi:hypothetical protein